MKKYISSLFAFLLVASVLQAQAPITEGHFVYELSHIETDNPQMGQVFAGATTTVDIKGQVYRCLTSMMGQQINVEAYNDVKQSVNYIYLNVMGKKIATQMPAEAFNSKWQDLNENTIITYDTEDTKEITGFRCYAAKIETLQDDGSVSEMQVYLTDAISVPNHLAGNFPEKLKGFPLEYSSSEGGTNMTFTLASYEPEVTAELTTDRNEYKEMPYEEFMNTIGKQMGL
jgi:hypothetical protein